MTALPTFIFATTEATLGKTNLLLLELAQRLVLRQNKSVFPQTIAVSLQSGGC